MWLFALLISLVYGLVTLLCMLTSELTFPLLGWLLFIVFNVRVHNQQPICSQLFSNWEFPILELKLVIQYVADLVSVFRLPPLREAHAANSAP